MLDKQTPLVVVLLIGGGKSLLLRLLVCIEENGVTVVVVRYRAFIKDLVRADVAGDITRNSQFLGYARLMKEKEQLQRVVVDECHLVITSRHWREDVKISMLVGKAMYMRAGTTRANARYFVCWCQGGKLEDIVLVVYKRWV